jgi:hypothetical protein
MDFLPREPSRPVGAEDFHRLPRALLWAIEYCAFGAPPRGLCLKCMTGSGWSANRSG